MKVQKEFISGFVVFLVSVPLCLGIALASGAPMVSGLLSGIIGGLIVGALSGSNTSISGPAAALSAIVLTSITEIGSFQAFLVAVILAGIFQIVLAFFKAGGMARFFPTSVVKGLLAAIGIIIIFKQIPHALGYDNDTEGDFSFLQVDNENTFSEIIQAFEHLEIGAIIIALFGLLIIWLWDKMLPQRIASLFPSSLFVIVFSIILNELFQNQFPQWFLGDSHCVQLPDGLSLQTLDRLFTFPSFTEIGNPLVWKAAITLAIIASLESLINLEASDNLDVYHRKSPLNRELFAQGIGNIFAGALGGLPITSVVLRSAVNINSGAKTKMSGILQAVYLLVFVVVFPDFLTRIPLSALAVILIIAGSKLISIQEFKSFYRKGNTQFLPFIITILTIVFTNLLIGVSVGFALAVFYILRSNFENPFEFFQEEYQNRKILKLQLSQQVSFFHKAAIESTLEEISENSDILIDGTHTDFLDSDVKEALLTYYQFGIPEKHLKFSFTGFHEKHEIADRINFNYVLTKELLDKLSPDDIIEILKKGNSRFVNGNSQKKDLLRQVRATSTGQHPMSVILACIDSRSATELIFDQGFGDIMSIRIAGNVVNKDILGSIEFACLVLGAKIIMVLGHTHCGAVKAAFGDKPQGNIAPLVDKIKESMHVCKHSNTKDENIQALAVENISHSINEIKQDSNLKEVLDSGKVKIIGAMYNIDTGIVDFLD